MATTGAQLTKRLRRFPGFRGVFANNEVPDQPPLQPGECLISNLENSNQPGTHWVSSLFIPSIGRVYIDSFGQPPTIQVASFLKPFLWSDIEFQELKGPGDDLCGEFATSFCASLCQGTFFSLLSRLTFQPSDQNNRVILDYYHRV